MKTTYPVILTERFLTLIADKDYSITNSDPRYSDAVQLFKGRQFEKLRLLLDRPGAIERYSKGNVKVYDGAVTYKGQEVHAQISKRILAFFKDGVPFEPLVAFLNNLYDNTSEAVRTKLYEFLEHNNLAITDNGNVIVYKMVSEDGTPPHCPSGFFFRTRNKKKPLKVNKYSVGHTFTLPREEIDGEAAMCNTAGLYVANRTYWGGSFDDKNNYTGSGRLLIAEIRPQDVCNVENCDSQKMVVCRLKIIGEYKKFHEIANRPVARQSELGFKPSGQRFHNLRDAKGHFLKKF